MGLKERSWTAGTAGTSEGTAPSKRSDNVARSPTPIVLRSSEAVKVVAGAAKPAPAQASQSSSARTLRTARPGNAIGKYPLILGPVMLPILQHPLGVAALLRGHKYHGPFLALLGVEQLPRLLEGQLPGRSLGVGLILRLRFVLARFSGGVVLLVLLGLLFLLRLVLGALLEGHLPGRSLGVGLI